MSPERNKREILAKSPLLNTFLNKRLSYNLRWAEALKAASEPLKNEVRERIGDLWEDLLIATLGGIARTYEVFSEDSSPKGTEGMIGTLFLIGYEVGSLDDVSIFSGDIVRQMYEVGFLKEAIHQDEVYKDRLARFLFGSVYAGVLIRAEFNRVSEESSRDIPPVFKDFIEGLDLS